jgi:hypothetical protein
MGDRPTITGRDIELYLSTVVVEGVYSNEGNLRFQLTALFGGIDFVNKRVLDIGGGVGLHSFYAACRGADRVVCLEPETKGSSSGVTDGFRRLKGLLECEHVELSPLPIQEFEPDGKQSEVDRLRLLETQFLQLDRSSKSLRPNDRMAQAPSAEALGENVR